MAQVLTEGTNLNVAAETTLGTLPSAGWLQLQPNSYGDIGPSIGKVARQPISKNRQNRQPIITDLDSGAPFQADVTKDLIDAFLPGIFMSAVKHSGGTTVGTLSYFRPTAVTNGAPSSYTVAAGGTLVSGGIVYGRGFANSANNGLHVLTAGSTGTTIKTNDALVTETPPANATLDFVGVQGAAGDIEITSGNLTSTALDFTTLGLYVGQYIYIPTIAEATAMGSANYAFATQTYSGFARIKAIATNIVTLEWRSWTVGASTNETTTTIRVFFSRWCRNVALDHADFLKTSYSFEVTYPGLGAGPVDEYEYLRGNYVDQWVWNIPLTSKATAELAFVGTTSNDPTTSRQGGASSAIAPVTNVAVSTSTDMMRFKIANVDESGISTDFKNIKITLKNNVSPEKQIGTLGATIVNVGRFECMVEADLIFTSDDVIKATRDNRQVHMDFAMRNGEFGCMIDIMAAALNESDRSFPTNASVLIKTNATAFQDPTLASTCGISVFGYLPR